MASLSYWLLSPSFLLALIGKVRGWDNVEPTPTCDWRKATVDVAIPAKNEERTIALALESLLQQDFPIRRIIVVDDGSTDRTGEVAWMFSNWAQRDIEVVVHDKSIGKTPSLREVCEGSDAEVLFVLDADTVLSRPDYISRTVEELFRNAGVASVCGEVMPLTAKRRAALWQSSERLRGITDKLRLDHKEKWSESLFLAPIVAYRTALYLFLHRVLYDGHQKLIGNTLNPAGCAVSYNRRRLADCFAYAAARVGDNMSTSEDIYIGHFFSWKGYRNVHIASSHCESTEPRITGIWKQLFLWSSSLMQSFYYFPELALAPIGWIRQYLCRPKDKNSGAERRRVQEQYRAAWGEQVTRRSGRPVGVLSLAAMVEKLTYPLILAWLCIWSPETACITVAAEIACSTLMVMAVAERGSRLRSGMLMVAATPVRLLTVAVDLFCLVRFCIDLGSANRNWRK